MGEAIEAHRISRAKQGKVKDNLTQQVSRVVKAARELISIAEDLQRKDVIRRHNAEMVREAMDVVINTLRARTRDATQKGAKRDEAEAKVSSHPRKCREASKGTGLSFRIF